MTRGVPLYSDLRGPPDTRFDWFIKRPSWPILWFRRHFLCLLLLLIEICLFLPPSNSPCSWPILCSRCTFGPCLSRCSPITCTSHSWPSQSSPLTSSLATCITLSTCSLDTTSLHSVTCSSTSVTSRLIMRSAVTYWITHAQYFALINFTLLPILFGPVSVSGSRCRSCTTGPASRVNICWIRSNFHWIILFSLSCGLGLYLQYPRYYSGLLSASENKHFQF